jgi:hypothetical protein
MKHKYSYNDNINTQQEYVADEFFSPGVNTKEDTDTDKLENRERDGNEFREFRRNNRLRKLKKLKKKKLKIQPTSSTPYGYTGFEGAYTSPLEYYSGSITNDPGAITNNPYNDTYQTAHSRNERLKIRAMIFKDFIIKG